MKAFTQKGSPGPYSRFQAWAVNHLNAFLFSFEKLCKSPLSTTMTLLVIAVAMSLPASLYLILSNVQKLAPQWDRGAGISLVIADSVSDEQLPSLATDISRRDGVAGVQAIGRAEALAEFRRFWSVSEPLDSLGENPLPAVILVTPTAEHRSPQALESLAQALLAQPEVEDAHVDLLWVQRLLAMTEALRRGTIILALLLFMGVLLVVGNTIRLDIQNRREEIEVAKLVGATDAFIRRPFVYGGITLGLVGALLALLMLYAIQALLNEPIGELSQLYGSDFQLEGPGFTGALGLLVSGAVLGLFGAWFTVSRRLRDIEP